METPALEHCIPENPSKFSISESPSGREQEHDRQDRGNPSPILDLNLSSKESDQDSSNPELNLIDSFDANSSETPQGTEAEPRVFSCNYCQRKFYSSQALGGHQNAHKRERTLARRGQRFEANSSAAAFGHPNTYTSRFTSLASLPLHGSSFHKPLGIQVHSMIQKPSFLPSTSLGSSNLHGRNGWSRLPIDQKPAIGRLVLENFHVGAALGSSASSGAARFEGRRMISPGGEGTGEFWWDRLSHLKSKQDDVKKLDLSLKL